MLVPRKVKSNINKHSPETNSKFTAWKWMVVWNTSWNTFFHMFSFRGPAYIQGHFVQHILTPSFNGHETSAMPSYTPTATGENGSVHQILIQRWRKFCKKIQGETMKGHHLYPESEMYIHFLYGMLYVYLIPLILNGSILVCTIIFRWDMQKANANGMLWPGSGFNNMLSWILTSRLPVS